MKTQAGQPILGGLIRMDYCCHIFPPNRPLETCICMGIHVYTLAGLEIFGQLTSGSYIKRDICSYFGPQPKACIDMHTAKSEVIYIMYIHECIWIMESMKPIAAPIG